MKTVKFLRFKPIYESANLTKEQRNEIALPIIEFMKDISQDNNFQQGFFGHAITLNKDSIIPYTIDFNRRQLMFKCFNDTWEITDERREVMVNKINSFVSETVGKFICDNSYDADIQACNRDITGNAHFTVLNNESEKHPIERHLFTIKLPLKLNKNTAFKEGSKVLFINYMIKKGISSLTEAINKTTYPNFIKWLNDLSNTNNRVKGMTNADFKKMLTYFTTTSFDLVNEFIKAYQTSCDMIYNLAADSNSYVTRDESTHGILRQFKQYVSAQLGTKAGKKAHPADLIMVGSKFDKLSCAISNDLEDDNLYCAISLKEHVARWGKATSAITVLKAQYMDEPISTFDKVRDKHLYAEIDKIISAFKDMNGDDDKTQLDVFESLCNKFKIWLPGANYGVAKATTVTCKSLQNINELNTSKPLSGLSKDAISNLFITALLFSQDDILDRKAFFAYLINSSLQLGTTPYYVAKDGQKDLIEMDSNVAMTANNIENVTGEYTAAGDKKVTSVVISLKISPEDGFNMPTAKHNNKVELDVRQGGRGKRNTVIEFK